MIKLKGTNILFFLNLNASNVTIKALNGSVSMRLNVMYVVKLFLGVRLVLRTQKVKPSVLFVIVQITTSRILIITAQSVRKVLYLMRMVMLVLPVIKPCWDVWNVTPIINVLNVMRRKTSSLMIKTPVPSAHWSAVMIVLLLALVVSATKQRIISSQRELVEDVVFLAAKNVLISMFVLHAIHLRTISWLKLMEYARCVTLLAAPSVPVCKNVKPVRKA